MSVKGKPKRVMPMEAVFSTPRSFAWQGKVLVPALSCCFIRLFIYSQS